MIELRDLSLAVPGRTLVRDITATIEAGEFVAVLGPNGAGKTTLLRTVCGIAPIVHGSIAIGGRPLQALSNAQRARAIAFVTADDSMIESLRVRDVVAIGRFPYHAWWQWQATERDGETIDRALRAVHMREDAQRLFSTLSSGERQRVWIAMGLAQETPVLLLDEPTSHLDVRVAHEILALLRALARSGHTVVCVLHDLNDAATYADRLMLLGCERMLACAPPAQVLVPSLIERAYGVAVHRIDTPDGPRVFAKTSSGGAAEASGAPPTPAPTPADREAGPR